MTARNRRTARVYPRRSRRFGYGLLAYLVLTIVAFDLVWRGMPRLAARVGHIEYGWLRFSIYFVVYIAFEVGATFVLRRLPLSLRLEDRLRRSFFAGVTLSFAVAFYQNRFGAGLSTTYFAVGLLGTFAGCLLLSHAYWGLVEVNAAPTLEAVEGVRQQHAGIVLADDLWDHVKRVVELVLALALIVISLPISLLLAMIVWVQDPGPLLVAKVVVGRGGRSFHQLKLRSMIKNAESATGAVPAAPQDARITPFGQLLRRTHIDELPQIINVLRGDMSLVGPRPDRVVFAQRNLRVLPSYAWRHAVRPGLAGLAQVYGDYYSLPREKLRYDLLYIRRRSFALDLKLFLSATLLALFGAGPATRRGRRAFTEARQDVRWRRAHAALHGGDPVTSAQLRSTPRADTSVPKLARLSEADDGPLR